MGKKRRRQPKSPFLQRRPNGGGPQHELLNNETSDLQRNLIHGRNLSPVDLQHLQRTMGNQAVARLIATQSQNTLQRGPDDDKKDKWRPKLKPRKPPPKIPPKKPTSKPWEKKVKTGGRKRITKRTVGKKKPAKQVRKFPKPPDLAKGKQMSDRFRSHKAMMKAYKGAYTELPAHMVEAKIYELESKIAPQEKLIGELEKKYLKLTKWNELITARDLWKKVTYGPFRPKSTEFQKVSTSLSTFQNAMGSYGWNPGNWIINLQKVSGAVETWLKKYDSMWKSRKSVREAVKGLKKQVDTGLKKYEQVEPDQQKAEELKVEVDKLKEKKADLTFKRSDVWRGHVIKHRDEARLANVAHLLEAFDHPKHRTAEDLQPRFQEWLALGNKWSPADGPVPKAFYRWVDKWEKENKTELKKVQYLGQQEREGYKLQLGKKLIYKQSKQLYQKGMYVMAPSGEFYGGQEEVEENGKKVSFHHSSFMAGMPIAAAGHIKANSQGYHFVIDLESGHYQPLTRHMVKAVLILSTQHNVALKNIGVQPFASEHHHFAKAMSGEQFINELIWLKKHWSEKKPVDTTKHAPLLGNIIKNRRRKTDAYAQLKDAISAL